MSDQIFLLSDQNGALVGHMSFQGEKIIQAALVMVNMVMAVVIIIIIMILSAIYMYIKCFVMSACKQNFFILLALKFHQKSMHSTQEEKFR